MTPFVKIAFYNELEKISISAEAKENRAKVKRWMKNTAAVALGTGAGTGAFMLGERALGYMAGRHWNNLSPKTRRAILVPASGLATLGAAALTRRMLEEKARRDRG